MKLARSGLAGARTGVRRVFAVAGLAAVLVAATAVNAAPAHAASWTLNDGFYHNAADRWSPVPFNTGGGGHFSNNSQWAYEGSRYAYRWVLTGGSNYSGIQREVTVPGGSWTGCGAHIHFRAVQGDALAHFQLRNANTGAVVVTDWSFLSPSQGWQTAYIYLTPATNDRDLLVLAGVQEHSGQSGVSDVRIDHLSVYCDRIA